MVVEDGHLLAAVAGWAPEHALVTAGVKRTIPVLVVVADGAVRHCLQFVTPEDRRTRDAAWRRRDTWDGVHRTCVVGSCLFGL